MSARLAAIAGEWIDRSRPLRFRFDGVEYQGFAGDVVSSALWAAGLRVLGRSYKYHRPRGVLSLADHDVNVLAEDAGATNLRCDRLPLREGMELTAVNTLGSARRDWLQALDRLSALLPVGVYVKHFHRPGWARAGLERAFRGLAGLGRAEPARPRVYSRKLHASCDVLVVGAGPSGLAAALAAAESGSGISVWLVDADARAGGSLGWARGGGDDGEAERLRLLARASAHPNVRLLTSTCALAYYADMLVPLAADGQLIKLRPRALIVASGAAEQPAVFGNNDLPGVMLGSAAQRLIYRYAVRPMRRAVVLAANLEGYRVALDLVRAGVEVAAVVDLRPEPERSLEGQRVRAAGVRVLAGHAIETAIGSRDRVVGALVRPFRGGALELEGGAIRIRCDGIVMSVGFAPQNALLRQAGVDFRHDAQLGQFVPSAHPAGVFSAGRVRGSYDVASKLADGTRAGREAAAYLGFACGGESLPRVEPEQRMPSHPYPIIAGGGGKRFIDFDRDVELRDVLAAASEGFDSVELMKRYARVGVGPSQGKHSMLNAVRVLARRAGVDPAAIGVPTTRPFYQPVSLSQLAGREVQPIRQTTLQGRHLRAGAQFFRAGDWLRVDHYARAGSTRAACVRAEVRAVRTGVGLVDVGSLGKLELFGRDAAELLERVYTCRVADLAVGKTRYAIALDESGVIVDDGVIARLADQHFYVTTTSSESGARYRELLRHQQQWGLQLGIVNTTGSRAALNLAGPHAREVLSQLTDLPLSDAAFPYLGVRRAQVAGAHAFVLRVGFVGELGYELHLRSDQAGAVWDAVIAAGAGRGLTPFGVEAQRQLRLEKGHLIVGQDSDGLTQPYAAGLGWAVRMDKPFFVGQRSLRILRARPPKQQLVGFRLLWPTESELPEPCCLIIEQGRIAGRVTSIGASETLGAVIGLAYVEPALATPGTRFTIKNVRGRLVEAHVVPTPFYDPQHARQRGDSPARARRQRVAA